MWTPLIVLPAQPHKLQLEWACARSVRHWRVHHGRKRVHGTSIAPAVIGANLRLTWKLDTCWLGRESCRVNQFPRFFNNVLCFHQSMHNKHVDWVGLGGANRGSRETSGWLDWAMVPLRRVQKLRKAVGNQIYVVCARISGARNRYMYPSALPPLGLEGTQDVIRRPWYFAISRLKTQPMLCKSGCEWIPQAHCREFPSIILNRQCWCMR